IAVIGIALAWRFYVTSPDISEGLAERWAGAHRTLSNKYYVDELYNATIIAGTMASGRGLWTFDRRVVDGVVNGSGWVTMVGPLLLLFVSEQSESAIRWIASIVALVGFAVSIPLWFWYNPQNPSFQFVERATWIPSIGAQYFLGVDGFSTLLILLTTMMGSI